MSLAQYSAPNAPFVDSTGRLTYAGNAFLRQVWERLGGADSWSVSDLMQGQEGPSGAAFDALAVDLDAARLSTEVSELRALVQELSKTDIESQIAQLREQVAYGMAGLKRKRVIAGSIAITAGNTSNTFAIAPAVASLDLCDLRFLGATAAGGGITDSQVSVELTNTTTVTARRIGSTGSATAYFQITEYTQ